MEGHIDAERPHLDIMTFDGLFVHFPVNNDETSKIQEPLNVENTLWSNTVLANGSAIGVIVYTGRETKSVMNTSQPSAKVILIKIQNEI